MEGRLQSAFDASTADEAVRTQTTEARNFIENTLFVDWANAVLDGGGGDDELDRVRVMAQAMQRVAGDALYVDAVAAIDRAGTERARRRACAGASGLRGSRQRSSTTIDSRPRHPGSRRTRAISATARSRCWRRCIKARSPTSADAAHEAERCTERDTGGARDQELSRTPRRGRRGSSACLRWAKAGSATPRLATRKRSTPSTRMGDVEQAGAAHSLLAALCTTTSATRARAWQHRLIALRGSLRSRARRDSSIAVLASAPCRRSERESPETALSCRTRRSRRARECGRRRARLPTRSRSARHADSLGRNRRREADTSADAKHAAHLARSGSGVPQRVSKWPCSRPKVTCSVAAIPAAAVAAATARDRTGRAARRSAAHRPTPASARQGQHRLGTDRGGARRARPRAGARSTRSVRRSTEQRPISALDESWQLFDASVQLSLKEQGLRARLRAGRSGARAIGERSEDGSAACALRDVQAALGARRSDPRPEPVRRRAGGLGDHAAIASPSRCVRCRARRRSS